MAKDTTELQSEKLHLKAMIKVKEAQEGEQISNKDLELINQYSRKELTGEEVYTYPIVLTSNDTDREFEYFDKKDLNTLSKLFIGKTGIFDHSWKSGNQHSRIYKCKVESLEGEVNFKGEQKYILKAWAYTIKQGNEDLIAKVDSGIYKEVSIGFRISDLECSVCGNSFFDYENCKHYPGRDYKNQGLCYLRMKDPKDAYEFSFVAVPCNDDAGTIKGLKLEKEERVKEKQNKDKHNKNSDSNNEPGIFYAKISKRGELSMKHLKGFIEKAKAEKAEEISIPVSDLEKDLETYDEAVTKASDLEKEVDELTPKAKMGEQYVEDLKKECTRLGKMAEGEAFNEETMSKIFDKCDVEELKSFKSQYEKKVDEKYPPNPQTKSKNPEDDEDYKKKSKENDVDNAVYKM